MTCRMAQQTLSDLGAGLASGNLPPDVASHLAGCARCAAFLEAELALTRELRAVGRVEALPEGTEQRMVAALRHQRRRALPIPAAVAAAASSLLVLVLGGWLWWASTYTASQRAPHVQVTHAVATEGPLGSRSGGGQEAEGATALPEGLPVERPVLTDTPRPPTRVALPPRSVPSRARPAMLPPARAAVADHAAADSGWGADGPDPNAGGDEGAVESLTLQVEASALALDVKADGLSADTPVSSVTSVDSDPLVVLEVPASSAVGAVLEWEVEGL